ncbi:hypothetical protein E1B28_001639 [Marasmius oreades]|uniref:Uncharacterized protein n=1 Tax=Marasmius oreades TaxID=181124 RepID=A0A9P7V3S2_9AGAR|nr:uncharacterized protein E1B28_001639 [Marasmius oreades]KAG7099831.1 hypothetical protein E1B28_001639 [Marasmius oreades]
MFPFPDRSETPVRPLTFTSAATLNHDERTHISPKMLQQIQHPQASSSKLALGETTEIELTRDLIPESDIADQYYDNILSPDNQNSSAVDAPESSPPRPGSRLDFNVQEEINEVEAEAPVLSPKPPRFEWTKSLFQKIGIHRGSSSEKTRHKRPEIRPSHQDPLHPSSFPSPSPSTSASHSVETRAHSSLIDDIRFTLCASDEDAEATDGETSDEESEIDLDSLSLSDFDLQDPDVRPSSVTEATIGDSINPSVPFISPLPSSDLDESVMTSPFPDSEHHPKAISSYLPSCLSPRFLSKARSRVTSLPPQRHNYENRGHSRHALMHLKWFWATREEEWAEFENATRAYGGISSSPELPASSFASRFPKLFASARTRLPNRDAEIPSSPLMSMPPMTIHPRWGDLSGLKDSWCVHMDRYFVEVPIWRIRKSLWTADLQVMSMVHKRRRGESEESGCEEDDADTESLMHMSMLTGLSDDSDLTLVESDCEEEAATTQLASVGESVEAVASGKEKDKSFYNDDDEEQDEYFEDVDLDSPSSSSSVGASSSTCRYVSSSSKSSLTSCFENPAVLPSQPTFSFQPPYSPYCSTPNLLQGLGHPWATSWYHRSQLLLQLLANSAEHEKQPSGLSSDIEYEKNHQRSFTYEDLYPGALEKSTSSRSRTVSV